MDTPPTSCPRSEQHRLPHPPCPRCGHPRHPSWREDTGLYETTVDPLGFITYRCRNPRCPED